MLSEDEARSRILETTPEPESECVEIEQAVDRYLFGDLFAQVPLPGFDQSSMDGYALSIDREAAPGSRFKVISTLAAGDVVGCAVSASEAVRVFTGAPLPAGATAVVMQEDVRCEGDEIELCEDVRPGEFVRRVGEVLCRGQRIAAAGDRLTPGRIGVLASQGIDRVEVGRVPSVALITTGDELRPPGEILEFGQLYNSNAAMLSAALRSAVRGVRVSCRHVPDDLDVTAKALREGLGEADFVIVAGGVSVGERDFVKPALASLGVELDFWRVRVKPGKPLLYALGGEGQQVVGLPGNPVSALVCLAVFVLPAVRARAGARGRSVLPQRVSAVLAAPVANPGDRPHYLRGAIDSHGQFCAGGQQVSHGLLGLAEASALVRVAAGAEMAAGEMVEVILF